MSDNNLSPTNPTYHAYTGATLWSYIYFGNYPQTEVLGADLTPSITQAEYNENGNALVNGIKYKRICKNDTSNPEFFGSNDFRYFQWERIKWRVLQNNGKTLFVTADTGLDCKAFNDIKAYEEYQYITWEHCTLRSWLNNVFYHTAFDISEQKAIVMQEVINHAMPEFHYHTDCGNNTKDYIYLLSIPELRNTIYGFWDERIDWERTRNKKANRTMKASDYAHARGVWICPDKSRVENHYGNCHWLLRSLCNDRKCAAEIIHTGDTYTVGYNYTYIPKEAVVPALHIDLASDCWTLISTP